MRWRTLPLALLTTVLLAMLGGVLVLALWSGADGSLATTLDLAARHLPAGQTLEVKDVSGTLRGGGRIGWLRWQRAGLRVEARDTELAWTLRGLIDGQLRLSRLHVRDLHIDDQRPSSPAVAPTDLRLPLQVDTPFAVQTLEWNGSAALQLKELSGKYVFNSKEHRLHDGNVHISSGKYQFSGILQAQRPLALSVEIRGEVPGTMPGSRQTLTVLASASVRGQLAGDDATLAVEARLQPRNPAAATGRIPQALTATVSQAMQATVSARIQPWQTQPIASGHAAWQALDLAALWPQAPVTQLKGQVTVTPEAAHWRAQGQLTNALSGPWDRQRLPVEHLEARATYAGGHWVIESLRAKAAGGWIQAQGQMEDTSRTLPSTRTSPPVAPAWEGRATFQGINPAAVDARLAAAALEGELSARRTPQGLLFKTLFKPSSQPAGMSGRASPMDRLRLQTIRAEGRWNNPALVLDMLQLETDDAQLKGRGSFNASSQAFTGQLNLTLPGAEAALDGQLSHASGQGDLRGRVADAGLASRWLSRWPGMAPVLAHTALQGTGEFKAHWQGGWQQQGKALQIDASLHLPGLTLLANGASPQQAWRISDLQAEMRGSLSALHLSARTRAETGTRRFSLQAQARGGRRDDGAWQASVDSARLDAQDSLQPGTWTLQLAPGVAVDWQPAASGSALEVSAGQASLTGPAPGTARLDWQPLRMARREVGTTDWRSQGQIKALPFGWLALLGGAQIANLGLRGDMLLGGQWEMVAGERLRLRASLARTSGDLSLQSEDGSASPLGAGVREASLALSADGDALTATLRWDSARAGQAQATLKTRLQPQDGGWSWPADTPVTGSVRAQLPRVGVWSVLAPPGWRLRGTLDADATLSGTRAAPQWSGTLRADDLAVRSVVDGIEFSQGTLRASLNGQRLDIDAFSIKGASGAGGTGGLLTLKGFVLWPPAPDSTTAPAATALTRLHMELDAEAQALRVSARADRRLAVSGKLSARLTDARLVLRGTLKADQALFVLPEDTAPTLGEDVVVRGRSRPSADMAQAPSPLPAAPTAGVRVTPDIAVTLDLGPDFRLRGRGLVTRLASQLALSSNTPGALQPRLVGDIRTMRGTYKAYGQQLDIEEGVLRFSGPFDNPALDVRAVRPNLTQRVGVQITGTALSPRVRLFSEPELPDAEKLAWLVLGRSAANGGAESAVLQQAALALLGGNGKGLSGGLADALGLDELSVRGATSATDGTTATGATVTLGKRLSQDFYVAYERSLAGTMGTFYIFYDLSRRFTLRAQTGEHSAVDLIFTLRYD